MQRPKTQHTLSELTQGLDVTIKGDPKCVITGISPIHQAQVGHVTFLTNSLYRKYLATTQASAVILAESDAAECPVNVIISRNPYYTYSKIAAYFEKRQTAVAGVHTTAVIGEGCQIDPTASIGAYCVIGNHVKMAANVVIGPNCTIGELSEIGEATQLDANVTIYHNVKIGKRTHVSSGVVIGSDGFGIAKHQGTWHRVPQLGGVEIGDDVDIGANTSIDRGAIESTIIESGVKLDNLIQVAHNVRIGANTVIAACVGIAGSAVIGKNCMIGGASIIAGHVTIADNVALTGMTTVNKSIRESGIYSSGIIVGAVPNKEFLKNNARFNRLENLMQRVKTIELALKELTERKES